MATVAQPQLVGLSHFTRTAEERSLLRVATAGSVDDGKSTLLGRLLFDAKGAYEDQIEAVKTSKVNRAGAGKLDLSLLTDGLRAEREQGITIDVAYRYFATARRSFILADTPGHVQYTRNMATGASTADAALILVDATQGVTEQTRRHAAIAGLLGVRALVLVVNKMDLAGWSEAAYRAIERDFAPLAQVPWHAIPVSALEGDNVVHRSANAPWYSGPALLDHLETLEPAPETAAFRFPVQLVLRPDAEFRGYAGRIAAGRVRPGDEVVALPSGRRTRIERIVTFDGDLEEAVAPMSVTLTLTDEIDLSRGDVLAAAADAPQVARELEASVVWMAAEPLDAKATYLLQIGTQRTPARVEGSLGLNDIGTVRIETGLPLVFDAYQHCRAMGGFILIDGHTNRTVAAGMLARAIERARPRKSIAFAAGPVTGAERAAQWGHRAALLALPEATGIALERALFARHAHVVRLAAAQDAHALLEAGLIVIVPGEDGRTPEAILHHLTASGVLSGDEFTQGEGI